MRSSSRSEEGLGAAAAAAAAEEDSDPATETTTPASACSAKAEAEDRSSCPQLASAHAAATAALGGTPPRGEPATRDLSVETSVVGKLLLPLLPPRLASAAAAAAAWIGLNLAVAARELTDLGRACFAAAAAQSQSTTADAGSLEGRRTLFLFLFLLSVSLSLPSVAFLELCTAKATADDERASSILTPG